MPHAYFLPQGGPGRKGDTELEIESYDLNLDVDFQRSLVKGVVDIRVRSAEKPLRLNAAGMEIGTVSTDGRKSQFSFDKKKGRLTVKGVPKKESTVRVTFSKHVSDDTIFGLYKSKYGKEHLLVTDLEPAEARKVFPCKDEPSYKAVFRLKVVTEEGLSVISNMPIESTVKTKDGRMRFSFEPSPKMSTYLFFLGIGKFEEATTRSGKVRIIAASRPGQSKNSEFIRKISGAVLQEYQRYFGVPYSLSKLHLIALPEYHTGAMENWGAIASREAYVLVRGDSSLSDRRNAARVMAHEIAHQWFGDLVTMKWWDDLWLNESFATFMEAKMLDRLRPEWDTWRDFLRQETFRSLNADALSTTHPIQAKVRNVDEIGGLFDAISYGKGAAVLRMLESYVGEESFRKGVSEYLRAFSYSNANGEDLWNSLGKASGLPVYRVARAWITKPGFPLVRAKASKGEVNFSQTRFRLTGDETEEHWPIPLTFETKGRRQKLLLETRSASRSAKKPVGVVVNPKRTGFYIVLYDDAMYAQLAKNFSSVHSHDRAGILNDLYLFLQAGKVEPGLYFRFASLSGRLADPLLALSVTDQLANLNAIANEAGIVRDGCSGFYESQIRRIGLSARKGEDENLGMVREAVAAQLAKTSTRFAEKLAQMFDEFDFVDPNLKAAVATAYAVSRGESTFEPLISLLKKARSEVDRGKVYAALASFKEPELVEKTLDLTISGEVSRSDSGYALLGASVNPRARSMLWKWVVNRYDRLREIYGGSQQFYLYMSVVIPRCGVGRERAVRSFISGKRYTDGEMTFRRAFEQLDINTRLRHRLLSS